MTTADAMAIRDTRALSMRTACFGFVASTATMILIMVIIGNIT